MPLPKKVLAFTLVAAGVGMQAAWGQARGGGGAPTGGTGTRTTSPSLGTTTNTPTTATTPTTTSGTTGPATPIYITGRVMLEDGTPAPQETVIERVCGGAVHAEGFTDSRGYFGVNVAPGSSATEADAQIAGIEDPSQGGSGTHMGGTTTGGTTQSGSAMSSDSRLNSCELGAKLAGYRSQSVSLVDHRAMDNPDIGVILLHRLIGPEGGKAISAAMLAVPKDARKAYEKGQQAASKQRLDEAIKNYNKAVQLYPKFAVAWCEMGIIQAGHGADEDARKSFNAAVNADPKYVTPYLQLSLMEMSANRWQPLADVTAKALKLDSFSYPIAHFFNALANYNLGNLGPAELEARQTQKLDTRHEFPKANQLLGLILAQRHDYLGAADELRSYLKLAPNSPEAPQVRAELQEVEKLSDANMPRVLK